MAALRHKRSAWLRLEGYVTMTLMTFDNQSNDRRIEVESYRRNYRKTVAENYNSESLIARATAPGSHRSATATGFASCDWVLHYSIPVLSWNKLCAWRHNMPPPLQVDNIFVFIRQVVPVPTCWLFNTATSWPFDLQSGVRVTQTSDRHQTNASLNASTLFGWRHNNPCLSVTQQYNLVTLKTRKRITTGRRRSVICRPEHLSSMPSKGNG